MFQDNTEIEEVFLIAYWTVIIAGIFISVGN